MLYGKFLVAFLFFGIGAVAASSQVPSRDTNRATVLLATDRIDGKVGLIEGNVVLVHDGDSLTLVTRDKKVHNIQLRGVDAPEPAQRQAERSKENLAVMAQGMDVTVLVSGAEVDGTYFGTVYAEGLDVGLKQIEMGLAWYSVRRDLPMPEEEAKRYEQAEKHARSSQLAIWSEPGGVPPWEFRAGKRSVPAESPLPAPETAAARHSSEPGSAPAPAGKIIANLNSGIYHWPGCSGYTKVAARNRVLFESRAQAEAAGYRPAKNCR